MSYAMAAPLQAAVYQVLASDPVLAGLVGTAIHDAVPGGPLPGTYVVIGDEDVRDRSDKDGGGAWHDFTVQVVTNAAGYRVAKEVASAVSDALLGTPMSPSRGRVAGLWFRRARARRIGDGDQRRIELRFRARTEDD